jgi:MOSC domain-containing protein YiiM
MGAMGKIHSINVSVQKGVKKNPVDRALINSKGIEGDGHSGDWHRQVSLLPLESIISFNSLAKMETKPGEFGENITTSGIDLKQLKIGDRLIILEAGTDISGVKDEEELQGKKELNTQKELNIQKEFFIPQNLPENSVVLELTQIGKECHTPCRIFYEVGRCIMPAEGIFFRVIKTGEIKPGYNIFFL